MTGEREGTVRQMGSLSTGGQRGLVPHDRRAPSRLRNTRHTVTLPSTTPASAGSVSPLFSVVLTAGQGLAIIGCGILLAMLGHGGRESTTYVQAVIAGLGVAAFFACLRPLIRVPA